MVDWHSPTQLARNTQSLSNLLHVLFGLYLWEFCTSFSFELSFITGKRKFRWPLIFYFTGRYCLLATLIAFVIAFNTQSELNCEALYVFIQTTGNFSIGMASINLSLRTIVVWERKWYIVGPLVALSLGHWSFLLHGILVTAIWIPGQGCAITSTNSKLLSVILIYTMSFDFIVLLLTAIKLVRPSAPRSRLVQMIFADGLYYFIITFFAHLIATIFMLLNLNAIMAIIGNGPAGVTATIASSRVVRHLANFLATVETFPSSANGQHFGPQILRQKFKKPHTSVHVQMETLELSQPTTSDADGSVAKVSDLASGLDSEERQNSNEFKHDNYTS